MTRSNYKNLQDKAIGWFWIILFISTILYLRWLLVEMHLETTRLSEERQRFQIQMDLEREKSKELYSEFYAELNNTIMEVIESLNKGEIPYKFNR